MISGDDVAESIFLTRRHRQLALEVYLLDHLQAIPKPGEMLYLGLQ
jgi:hypothetical protein